MESEICSTTLSLGSLELSLQDVLRLRPGSIISLPLPDILEGVLQFAGNDWARVHMKMVEGCIEITVVTVGPVSEKFL